MYIQRTPHPTKVQHIQLRQGNASGNGEARPFPRRYESRTEYHHNEVSSVVFKTAPDGNPATGDARDRTARRPNENATRLRRRIMATRNSTGASGTNSATKT